MKLSTKNKNLIRITCIIGGTLLSCALFIALARYITPMIVATVLYYLSKPLSTLLSDKLKLKNKVVAIITTITIMAVLVAIAVLIVLRAINEVQSLVVNIATHSEELSRSFTDLFKNIEDKLDLLHPKVADAVSASIANLFTKLSSMVSTAASKTVSMAISFPKALVFIIASAVCTFMLIKDKHKIYGFFERNLPESLMDNFEHIKKGLFTALFGYIKAQTIMCGITFCELIIVFSIMRIKYALLLAIVIAIIDALPLFGCGLFLVPWTIFSFVTGDLRLGIGIGILYICTLSIRQMVEPRILGHNIGVYPLLTLLSMYAGLQLWGVGGLFLGPLTVLILKGVLEYVLDGQTLKQYIRYTDRRKDQPAAQD